MTSITAGEFCNRQLVIATRSESVLAAARRMREHHVGSLVVVEETDGRRCLAFDDLIELFSEEMTDLAEVVSRERKREEGHIG